ncbi:ABSCISIC ACID-INSENSITIVE 5-like protein 7 [Brassica napus]|uniref:(rape) hypothetical protein n=1 Tax=Brassica napus TaxID=3708 RepID=A0A816WKP0_BRANA|nr:ABSCISIC ACID-INSENSITIVE 5-like protein 7 [Brassica napus]XP_022572178.1 ABSCISIC ACID-INSENSITIVE 5-like protein 7 [Brassica napus]XP_022572179.1 ABSCISIC ACID-INSENSITIVE 5-like protein 7 [Brassica napus]XP_048632467.1 ABSCISIC ACID-INSENSITIVE 5-like protein 7 [Brassica napus]XP_048632468.1 ABSCISIC ACID-INSENSITIVE 5-like protein 7 [Brassica napus]CAF2128136.1 unnamed protein product [Brassica napus]
MGTHINFNSLGGGGSYQMKPTDSPNPLARQSSVYSLTFDELQSTFGGPGKDLGSMNMDELLKSIWTAEEAQAMTSSAATAVAQHGGGNLQRQGSLTLPRTISQKTVDEVWKFLITKDGEMGGSSNGESNAQQTLGEMKIEDFLFRAGVVREDNNEFYGNNGSAEGLGFGFGQLNQNNISFNGTNDSMILNQPPGSCLKVGGTTQHQRMPQTIFPKQTNVEFAASVCMVNKGFTGAVNNDNGLASFRGEGVKIAATSPGTSSAENNSLSPVPYVLNRGRRSNTGVEKVIERRQRRKIKNRESAARSRARKQAYTLELEAEIEKLKKVNQELQRKQAEMMEMQKNEVNEPRGSKRQCLRRTLTGPW